MEEPVWYRKGTPLHQETHAQSAVIFDPDTGETHFLSDLPSIVLHKIDDFPATLSVLIGRLDGPENLEPEAREQILTALMYLERAELVTSAFVETD